MVADLPELPAGNEATAALWIAEGLCPHCGDDLVPTGWLGRCHGCELGWAARRSPVDGQPEVAGGFALDHPQMWPT